MYKFNFTLFSNLNKLLGLKRDEFSMLVFGYPNKYATDIHRRKFVRMRDVLKICNLYHISFADFITTGDHDLFTNNASTYIINATNFAEITFNYGAFRALAGAKKRFRNFAEIASLIEVSTPTISAWEDPERMNMPIEKLFTFCNLAGVDIRHFIDDKNRVLPPVYENSAQLIAQDAPEELMLGKCLPTEPITTHADRLLELQKEVSRLHAAIDEKERFIQTLQQENIDLRNELLGARQRYENDVCEQEREYAAHGDSVRSWSFHKLLLSSLPVLLDTCLSTLMGEAGVGNITMQYNDGDIRVQSLINLCNQHRIPAKCFFRRGHHEERLFALSYYQRSPEDYQTVTFQPKLIKELFGTDSLTGRSLTEVINDLDVRRSTIDYWSDAECSTITISQLTEICDILDLSPFVFIHDPNKVAGYGITQAEYFLEELIAARQRINQQRKLLANAKRRKQPTTSGCDTDGADLRV